MDPDAVDVVRDYLRVLEQLKRKTEFVAVVNGDIDLPEGIVEELDGTNLESCVVKIHRKSDDSTAIRAGLQASRGEIVVLLPSYRQVDPAAVSDMIGELDNGYDYVASYRNPRVDSWWSTFKSKIFNSVTRWLTSVPLRDINSGLRVLKRQVMEDLPFYGDMHRFLPILAAMQGFRISEVSVQHVQERVGKGDTQMGVYGRRVLDLLSLFFLFKFVKKPLRFFGLIGSACLVAGSAIVGTIVVQRFVSETSLSGRPALLLGVLLVVLGVQLFSLGLLGELIIFVHGKSVADQYVDKIYEHKHSDVKEHS